MSTNWALKKPLLTHDQAEHMLYGILLAAIVLAGIWLRWRDLGSQSLWEDEGYTLWISRFSPQEIWHILRMDNTTPLLYVLIHYWSYIFGTSEFSLRAPSAVFATLSIPLFFLLARKVLVDKMAVTFAMVLYAVSFFQVWHARNARFYSLLIFLSLGTVHSLLHYLENRRLVPFCGLVLSWALSLYTHNMVLLYLPGFVVLWLVYPAERTLLARLRDGLLVASVVLLLYLPWVPTLAAQARAIRRVPGFFTPGVGELLGTC
jgi:mannosyltransferase